MTYHWHCLCMRASHAEAPRGHDDLAAQLASHRVNRLPGGEVGALLAHLRGADTMAQGWETVSAVQQCSRNTSRGSTKSVTRAHTGRWLWLEGVCRT
jgi:hypothetical protein